MEKTVTAFYYCALAAFLLLAAPAAQSQTPIHYWSFNDGENSELDPDNDAPTTIPADIGDGVINHNLPLWQQGTFARYYLQPGFEPGQILRVTRFSGDPSTHIDIVAGTEGFRDIRLGFASAFTSQGWNDNSIEVSTDGGTTFSLVASWTPNFSGLWPLEFDLSAVVPEVDDNANVVIRIGLTRDGFDGSGDTRFENVTVMGTPILPNDVVLMSYWHFNEPVDNGNPWPQPLAAKFGRGDITYDLTEASLTVDDGTERNARRDEPAGDAFVARPWSSEQNNGRHFQVNVSTVGFENLTLAYDFIGDENSFDSRLIEFSVDEGTTWTEIAEQPGTGYPWMGAITTVTEPLWTYWFLLEDFTALNDAAEVLLRFTLDGAEENSALSQNIFDNITLEGTVRPDARLEPAPPPGEDYRGWRMLSAAKGGMTVQDLADLSLVQGLTDEYPDAEANVAVTYSRGEFVDPETLAEELEPGRGFLWYVWSEPGKPDDDTGVSRNHGLPMVIAHAGPAMGSTVSQTFSGVQSDGWFLLGNPFDEPFHVSDISVDSGSIQNTLYHWDPTAGPLENGSPVGDYVELFRDGAGEAAVWDGFFAEVPNPPAGDVTFTYERSNRTEAPEPAERHLVNLELNGTMGEVPAYDRNATILFSPDADEGWDEFDASKLYPLSSTWAILSPMGDKFGEHVAKAIESRPLPDGLVSVPVAISSLAGGEFTISLGDRTDAPEEWTLEIEDTVTGQVVDLRTGSISFTLDEAVWMEERFIVRVMGTPVDTTPTADTYEFALEATYPNPFSASATVAFTLAETSDVNLNVYDVLGRRVLTLADGELGAGRHAVSLDGSSLASGVYVVRLSAAGQVATQRVTVVR